MTDLLEFLRTSWVHVYYVAVFAVIWASSMTFVVLYHLHAPWWRSDVGKNYMAFAGSLALLSGHIIISIAFPDYPGRRGVLLAGLTAIAVLMVWRLFILRAAQKSPAPKRRAEDATRRPR